MSVSMGRKGNVNLPSLVDTNKVHRLSLRVTISRTQLERDERKQEPSLRAARPVRATRSIAPFNCAVRLFNWGVRVQRAQAQHF